MMGLKQWVLWSTWYLKQFLFFIVTVIIMTVLVKVSSPQPEKILKNQTVYLFCFDNVFRLVESSLLAVRC